MKIRNGFVSNSSSCSFVCQTKYTLKETKKILQKMLNSYNDTFNENNKFEDVFGKLYIGDTNTDIEFKKWGQNPHAKIKEKIIIDSKSDNTIPWSIMKLIEEKFNADHYHWG